MTVRPSLPCHRRTQLMVDDKMWKNDWIGTIYATKPSTDTTKQTTQTQYRNYVMPQRTNDNRK